MTAATVVQNGENRLAGSSPQSQSSIQSTSMSLVRQEPGAILSLAEKSGNPMEFLSKMGESIAKSGMLGLKKTEQGSTLLMICMTEGKTPLQVISEFHVMDDGKLARKADWVISRFREMGGEFKIIDDGENGVKATYEFTFRGNTRQVTYSLDEARAEGIVKPASRWTKNPASMLRARTITKGVRMVAPEVMAGFCTEEELDGQVDGPAPQTSAPRGRPPKDKSTEPAATASATSSPPAATERPNSQPAGEVVDAEYSPAASQGGTSDAAEPAAETVPFDGGTVANAAAATSSTQSTSSKTPEDHKKETLILDITFQLGRLGMSRSDYEAARYKKYQDSASLDGLPLKTLEEALAKVKTTADAKAPN